MLVLTHALARETSPQVLLSPQPFYAPHAGVGGKVRTGLGKIGDKVSSMWSSLAEKDPESWKVGRGRVGRGWWGGQGLEGARQL